MARHTPGEWQVIKGAVEGDDMRCAVVVSSGRHQYLLATIENGAPGDFCETEEANARLIAAAPELLNVAEEVMDLATYIKDYAKLGGGAMAEKYGEDPTDGFNNVVTRMKRVEKIAFAAISKATRAEATK